LILLVDHPRGKHHNNPRGHSHVLMKPHQHNSHSQNHPPSTLQVPDTATALYIYATFLHRSTTDVEMHAQRTRNVSPVMVEEQGGMRNLNPNDWKDLKWEAKTVFGPCWNHVAVAHVEALAQILHWDHLGRCWRKIGGDHNQGRPPLDGVPDVSQRVVRIMWTRESVDRYVIPDSRAECDQTFQGKLAEWTDPEPLVTTPAY
jgi:hypothetical protein